MKPRRSSRTDCQIAGLRRPAVHGITRPAAVRFRPKEPSEYLQAACLFLLSPSAGQVLVRLRWACGSVAELLRLLRRQGSFEWRTLAWGGGGRFLFCKGWSHRCLSPALHDILDQGLAIEQGRIGKVGTYAMLEGPDHERPGLDRHTGRKWVVADITDDIPDAPAALPLRWDHRLRPCAANGDPVRCSCAWQRACCIEMMVGRSWRLAPPREDARSFLEATSERCMEPKPLPAAA